jgi:hypothetical protein
MEYQRACPILAAGVFNLKLKYPDFELAIKDKSINANMKRRFAYAIALALAKLSCSLWELLC